MTEADMVLDCYSKLKRQQIYKEIVLEVPYLSRCIDMILVNENNEILSIEFKLKNWRKALEQAKDHKLGTDKSYICIPRSNRQISSTMLETLTEYGIGLLLYHEFQENPLEEFLAPSGKYNRWAPWVLSLRKKITKIAEKEVFKE